MMRFRIVLLFIVAVIFSSCAGTRAFKLETKINDKTEGFISTDIIQMIGIGFASIQQMDSKLKQQESLKAAIINAKMRIIDFIFSELENSEKEKYQSMIMKINKFSISRYDPIFGKELIKGGYRADGIFELFRIKGFVHKYKHSKSNSKCEVVYRVARAGLLSRARNAFGF